MILAGLLGAYAGDLIYWKIWPGPLRCESNQTLHIAERYRPFTWWWCTSDAR